MAQINEFLRRPRDEIIRIELKERTRKKIMLDFSGVVAGVVGYYALLHVGLLDTLPVEPVIPLYIFLVFAGIVSLHGIIRARRAWGANLQQGLDQLKSTLGPFRCPADERAYYREVHGVDPMGGWDAGESRFFYEAWYPLEADPQLSAVGVTIGARVAQVPGQGPSNRIIFRNRDGDEGEVYCTHTVVMVSAPEDALNLADDQILQRDSTPAERKFLAQTGGPVQLPPWGHFAALKSYVAGIAQEGLFTLLRASAERGSNTLLFGFNEAMRQQVLAALRKVAPAATNALVVDFFLELVDEAPLDWILTHIRELGSRFEIAPAFFSNTEFMRAFVTQAPLEVVVAMFQDRYAAELNIGDFGLYLNCLQVLLAHTPPEKSNYFFGLLLYHSGVVETDESGFRHMIIGGVDRILKGRSHNMTLRLVPVPRNVWGPGVDPATARCAIRFHFTEACYPLGRPVPGEPVIKHWLAPREALRILDEEVGQFITPGVIPGGNPWVRVIEGSGSIKPIRGGFQVKNTDRSRPLEIEVYAYNQECTFVGALAGISVLLWDSHHGVECPLAAVGRGLREWLKLDCRGGEEVLLEVKDSIHKNTLEMRDYQHRPLLGLRDPYSQEDCFARPFADLVGAPLTPREMAMGLDSPDITGCVMSAHSCRFIGSWVKDLIPLRQGAIRLDGREDS